MTITAHDLARLVRRMRTAQRIEKWVDRPAAHQFSTAHEERAVDQAVDAILGDPIPDHSPGVLP